MTTKYVQEGCVVDWTNGTGAAVASNAVVVVGLLGLGIALADIASTAVGSVQREGVFRLAKAAGALTQGQKVWWDATNSNLVNAPAKNAWFLGYAFRAAASGDTTADVRLAPFAEEGQRHLALAATGAESLTAADLMSGALTLLVPNTAAKTVNLPAVAAIPFGARLTVRKTDAALFAITLDPNASELIAGGATHAALDVNNDYAVFASNGTAWVLVDSAIA